MSDDTQSPSPAPESAPAAPPTEAETPAQHIAVEQKKKNFYLRMMSSLPAVVTILIHVLLALGAAAIVVQQTSGEKKKTFEAIERSDAPPPVEHRLQVARRGGASGGASSPVSANRIFTTGAGAIAMPEMPELPSMGASGFGGFSGMGSGVGLSAGGSGMATSVGGAGGLGGRGFMSLNFLGMMSTNVSKIVFVVDTSTQIMEPRKGGFESFAIIRNEMMKLVGNLPPSAQFNVVLFRPGGSQFGADINLYARELMPATTENKNDFFAWMTPVNASIDRPFGPNSATRRTTWRPKPVDEKTVDPLVSPPGWHAALRAGLEMQPDTVYVITASKGNPRRRVDEATIARRREEAQKRYDEFAKELEKEGLNINEVRAARDRAYNKLRADLNAANRRLVEQGKSPIIVDNLQSSFNRPDVQKALRDAGIRLELDRTGWTRKNGTLIDNLPIPVNWVNTDNDLSWNDFLAYHTRLVGALTSDRPTINMMLFVGPDENPEQDIRDLTTFARRNNNGRFQLLNRDYLKNVSNRDSRSR